MQKKRIQWWCLSGVVSAVFYVMHDIIGGLNYPGYNRLSQAVSDLTAANAPSAEIAGGLSHIYGIFSILCCAILAIYIEQKGNRLFRIGIYLFAAMSMVSAVGYALFPLSESGYAGTLQDVMHMYVVTLLVVVLSIASMLLISIGGFRAKGIYQSLGIVALCTLILMFCGSIGIGVVPKAYFGVAERFSTYSVVVFTAVIGIYGFVGFKEESSRDHK